MSQFALSLISGFFIGTSAAFLGTLMLPRKMVLAAGPLGHLALPGVALALLYGFDVSLGAFPFVILGIFLIWLLEIRTKLSLEALTAVVFTLGVALAFFFLPLEKAETALIGDIFKVKPGDVVCTVLLCFFVFFAVAKIFQKVILINISEDLAQAEGVNVKKYNLFYLFCVSIVVALGVKLVGGLLTAALTAIPPSAARNLAGSLKTYKILSVLFGGGASLLGIYLSQISHLPAGPLVITISGIVFIFSVFFKR